MLAGVRVLDGEPWRMQVTGRLVRAVGESTTNDGTRKRYYVDSFGAWCNEHGSYRPRPACCASLLDEPVEVPASLYNLLDEQTAEGARHVKLSNGAVLVALDAVTPLGGP